MGRISRAMLATVGQSGAATERGLRSPAMQIGRRRKVKYAGGALSVLMLGQCAPGGCVPVPPPPPPVEVQVLSFNDFHGHLQPPGGTDATLGAQLDPGNTQVGGAEYLASALAALRTGVPNSMTVAAGDLIGG